MEHITLLANQKSSKFNFKTMKKCEELLTKQHYKVKLVLMTPNNTNFVEDFESKLNKYSKESDKIICYGGDGIYGLICKTINSQGQESPIGFVSIGTANDMSKNLGLSEDPIEATNQIIDSTPHEHDIVTLNNIGFGYVSAFGPITNVTFNTDYRLKRRLGKFSYMISALPDILTLISNKNETYRLTYQANGQKKYAECLVGLVTNAQTFAGVNIYNDADLNDGKFETLLIKKEALAHAPAIIAEFIKGFNSGKIDINLLASFPNTFEIIRTDDLTITFDNLPKTPFNHDGDIGLAPCKEAHYQTKSKIKLLLPQRKTRH